MTDTKPQERLARALLAAMQRVCRRYPEMPLTDVCAAMGIAIGTVVGASVPPGRTETDLSLGSLIGIGYAQGVSAIRQQRAS